MPNGIIQNLIGSSFKRKRYPRPKWMANYKIFHLISIIKQNNAPITNDLPKRQMLKYAADKMTLELEQVTNMQKSIAEMQLYIQLLLKKQKDQEKAIEKQYNFLVKMAECKINYANTIDQNKTNKSKQAEYQSYKNNHVRQMRQKQINLLRQTKIETLKIKEMKRTEIKQISKTNTLRIQAMKLNQLKQNSNCVKILRESHDLKVKELQQKKNILKKQKLQKILQQNLIKISQKNSILDEMERLKVEEEQIKHRLLQREEKKRKIYSTTRIIRSLDHSKILQKSKIQKGQRKTHKDEMSFKDIQDIEKSLLRSALSLKEVPVVEPSMQFR